jgi:hypothetical protein
MTALLEADVTATAPVPGYLFTDAELTAQALAADPDQPLDPDAVPFDDGSSGAGLLPTWYMPTPAGRTGRTLRGWRSVAAIVVIVSFLLINALGLCITYGHLVPA